ncbi:Potassium voltage-gated channel sub H member 5 [Phytophthora pseudosyringae]|uniref:Potassium voltage-gated channel sub H member 5 n=1 Tax=Phytophthora pseudosyringae TaxID=221518 RepID=A0A8T1W047_9STRA|nr:Potassium voltage-gated channel sub H member 5 [Phytophthora pseudosyringae]
MFHRSIAATRALHRSPPGGSSREFSDLSVGTAGGDSSRLYDIARGDAVTPRNSSKADIRTLQFMVDTNPFNRLVRAILTGDHFRQIETESWARFKFLVTAQHRVVNLLENLGFLQTPAASAGPSNHQRFQTNATLSQTRGTRVRSLLYDEHASRKLEINRLVTVTSKLSVCIPAKPDAANKWKTMAAATEPTLRHFLAMDANHEEQSSSFTARALSPQPHEQTRGRTSKFERIARLGRSQSLPHFGRGFFEKLELKENAMDTTPPGIDFELLQHYQQVQNSVKLRLFHRSLTKNRTQTRASIIPTLDTSLFSQMTSQNILATTPRKPSTSDAMVNAKSIRSKLSQQLIAAYTRGSMAIIKTAKRMEKAWDLIMLLIAFYHLEVTTFKVCFSVDLTEVSEPLLRRWSEFEVFLDVLCVLDLSYQLRYGSTPPRDGITPQESRHLQTHSLALRVDILAMLPLELLLGAGDVRVPETHMPHFLDPATASWWTTRWLLRMNRLLLVRHIGPLSEKLLQFLIHDRKVHVNEAVLDFVRGLAMYLTMGHLLACTWFLSDKLSNIITSDISQVEVHVNGSGTSLLQKYLGALLFAMDSISTLFYGDILAMNPADVVVDLGITLWSIYIYGALVGAQSDLFAARARRQAAFEQTLLQLQHYLVQNEVPKEIKRQVKAYYAQLWHRRKGEAEFAPVGNVSRALYEEIVLAATQTFAAQVTVFRALDDRFLRALLTCLQYVVCSANEEVFVIGDMDRSMYFIAQGRVAVKMGSSESTRERGEFFGELALLYGISRLETCVALTATELYRLDHEPYERLLLEYPEYRARNKLAWTTYCTSSARDRSVMEEALRCFRQFGVSAVHATSCPNSPTLETNSE